MNHKSFWCFQVQVLNIPNQHDLRILSGVHDWMPLFRSCLFFGKWGSCQCYTSFSSPIKIGLEVFSWKPSPSGFVAECFSTFFPLAKWRGDILFVWLMEDNSFIFCEYKMWLLCGHKSNYAFKDWTFTRNMQSYCEREQCNQIFIVLLKLMSLRDRLLLRFIFLHYNSTSCKHNLTKYLG